MKFILLNNNQTNPAKSTPSKQPDARDLCLRDIHTPPAGGKEKGNRTNKGTAQAKNKFTFYLFHQCYIVLHIIHNLAKRSKIYDLKFSQENKGKSAKTIKLSLFVPSYKSKAYF
jgi:hypothetical protein